MLLEGKAGKYYDFCGAIVEFTKKVNGESETTEVSRKLELLFVETEYKRRTKKSSEIQPSNYLFLLDRCCVNEKKLHVYLPYTIMIMNHLNLQADHI